MSNFTCSDDTVKYTGQAAVCVDRATNLKPGVVQPDGSTIVVNSEGVISAPGSGGGAYAVNGVPLGAWFWYPGGQIPEGYLDISLDHGLLNRADHPALWATICQGCNAISEAEYLIQFEANGCVGAFSTGDCATTFRLPLIRGVYARATDMADVNKLPGKYMGDQFQGHGHYNLHSSRHIGYGSTGAGWQSNFTYDYCDKKSTEAYIIDPAECSPYGEPRYGDETRPKTLCQTPIMKVKEAAVPAPEPAGINYSLDEQWTGRHWIDGKKIYQKTVICPRLGNNSDTNVVLGIENVDKFLQVTGYVISNSTGDSFNIPYGSGGASDVAVYISAKTTLRIYAFNNKTMYDEVYATIQYTCTDR